MKTEQHQAEAMPRIGAEILSELIGAIYDSAIDQALWPETLDLIRRRFDLANTHIELFRARETHRLIHHVSGVGADEKAELQRLSPHVAEIWGGLDAMRTRPIDIPWVASRISTFEQWQSMTYYRERVKPRKLADCAKIILARDATLFGSVALTTSERRGVVDDALFSDICLLLPHLQRAARISGLLDASTEAAQRFEGVIDALSTPVVLVASDMTILHANRAARTSFEARKVLAENKGLLVSPVPGVSRALSNLVARACENETCVPGNGIGLPVRTHFDELHTLHVLPMVQGSVRPHVAGGASVAIFVSSASVSHNLVRDVLQPLFNLTPAEMRVFEYISSGHTTPETAAALGIAMSTLRTHLLRLFSKTGVNRQADLIRMASSLASPTLPDGSVTLNG